jgi:hypothetical protein
MVDVLFVGSMKDRYELTTEAVIVALRFPHSHSFPSSTHNRCVAATPTAHHAEYRHGCPKECIELISV